MKTALIICIALYVFLQVLAILLDKWNKKVNAKHKAEINERCENVLESAARTEATIVEARKEVGDIPEEYRAEFLAKYDEIEERLRNVREDVERIRKSVGNEVTCNGTE